MSLRPAWLLVPLLLGACERSRTEPSTAGSAPRTALVALAEDLDLGEGVQFAEVRLSATLKNNGSGIVTVLGAEPGHSCSAEPAATSLDGGQLLSFELRCRPRTHGAFLDTITLRTDPALPKPLRLSIGGHVEPALTFEQDFFDLTLVHGEARTQRVRVTGARRDDPHLALRAVAGEPERHGIVATVVSNLPGPGIEIEASALRAGQHAGLLTFDTGLDEPRQISLPYSFTVTGTLTVSPRPVYVNLRRLDGAEAALVDIQSTQEHFEVHAVEVLEGPVVARLEQVDRGHYRARLELDEQAVDEQQRGLMARLAIRSNDRTEPRLEVPVFAFGKLLPRTEAPDR